MKKIVTLLAVIFFGTGAFAQFTTNWFNKYQFTSSPGFSNEARKVAVDATGNIFEVIDVTADLDSNGNHSNTTQFFVIVRKLNAAGTVLATKLINVNSMALSGAHDYKASFGMVLDSLNNVYVGFNKYNGSNYDACVYKYNNTLGSLLRASVYSTSGDDIGFDMKIRSTSAIILVRTVLGASTSYSVVNASVTAPPSLYTFAANTEVLNALATATNKNIFVTGYSLVSGVKQVLTASVNASGLLKWQRSFNNGSVSGNDFGSEIMIGTDGDIYVSGTTYGGAANSNDVIVLRYTYANANLVWSLPINLNLNDAGSKIANGPAGFIYVANNLVQQVVVYKIQTALPASVTATVHYFPTPASTYTTINGVTITDMKVSASNNAYICGAVTGTSPIGNFSASYLVKIGTGFTVLASNTVEGNNPDNYAGAGLALSPTNNNVITLRSYWSGFTAHTDEKAYITSLNAGTLRETASETITSGVPQVSFFPNPASGSVYFTSDQTITSVELSNITGQLVATLNPQDNMLDISNLKSGLYLAKVITSSGVTVKRIIVQ